METQLSGLGMPAERFAAAMPETICDEDVAPLSLEAARENLSPVELAISISHFRAWRRMLERGNRQMLVLEDDLRLSHLLPSFLNAFESQAANVELLRLETHGTEVRLHRRAEPTLLGISLHLPLSFESGAGAYVISENLARRILSSARRFAMPIDDLLFSLKSPFRDTRHIRMTVPALAIYRWEVALDFDVPYGILLSDAEEGRAARQQEERDRHRLQRYERSRVEKVTREIRRLGRQMPGWPISVWHWCLSRRMVVPFAGADVSVPPSTAPPRA